MRPSRSQGVSLYALSAEISSHGEARYHPPFFCRRSRSATHFTADQLEHLRLRPPFHQQNVGHEALDRYCDTEMFVAILVLSGHRLRSLAYITPNHWLRTVPVGDGGNDNRLKLRRIRRV
jgi:hypothetical protein